MMLCRADGSTARSAPSRDRRGTATRSNLWLVIIALLIAFALTTPVLAGNSITGVVFRDYNANGIRDTNSNGVLEPGVTGVTVTAYDVDKSNAGSTVTLADGSYLLSPSGTGPYRLEYTDAPSFLSPGPHGAAAGSQTTVVFSPDPAIVNVGLANPADYCQSNPDLCTNVYTYGPYDGPNANLPTIISFPYTAAGVETDVSLATTEALQQHVGATFGLAYHRSSNTILAASFTKRLVGYGPGTGTPASDGTGTIYAIPVGAPIGATPFFDLDDMFGVNISGADPHTDMNGSTGDLDLGGYGAVGRVGLGDIDFSEDDETLWVVNLYERALYGVPVGLGLTVPLSTEVKVEGIPSPGCIDVESGEPVAFALKVHDGVVYVGGVCNAENSQNRDHLEAYVYAYDPVGGTWSGTPVLRFPLNYRRGCAAVNINYGEACSTGETGAPGEWEPWTDVFPIPGWSIWNNIAIHPQPMLTDIEFDGDDMILGFTDRFAHMLGSREFGPNNDVGTLYSSVSAGDILRAGPDGTGGWTNEGNSHSNPPGIFGPTPGANSNQGPPFDEGAGYVWGEFYYDDRYLPDGYHAETTLGGLAQIPGLPEVASTAMDPVNGFSGGIIQLNNTTGVRMRTYEYYTLNESTRWGKAAGLGDLEPLCGPAPIEIGNRVWHDEDLDGIQDSGEAVLPGVKVELWMLSPLAAAVKVGEATTDGNGNYYFGGASDQNMFATYSVLPNTDYELRISLADSGLGGKLPSLADQGTDLHDSDGDNGSINAGHSTIVLATAGLGANDHTFDFGFGGLGSIGDTVWCDVDYDGQFDAGEGVAVVTVNLYSDAGCDGTEDILLDVQDTAGDGQYLFTGLPVGPTGQPVCYVVEVDAADMGDCDSPITPGSFAVQLDEQSPTDLTADFGFERYGSIGDTVWCDVNPNSLYDPGEGVAGVTVSLYEDTGCDTVPDGLLTAQDTAGDGQYLFATLEIGVTGQPVCYVVEVDSTDMGTCDNAITQESYAVPLDEQTPDYPDADFGFDEQEPPRLGSIGDTVWCDLDLNGLYGAGEGVAGVTVSLYEDLDCDDTAEALLASQDTVGDGQYLFSDLPVGVPGQPVCYVVEVDPSDMGDCDSPITPESYAVELDDEIPDHRDADFGFEMPMDLGDAPGPGYPTLLASNGARHPILPGYNLGSCIDAEPDGQPNLGATGDDLNGECDDEDGIVLVTTLVPGETGCVDVTASAPGYLNAWIDFASDGSWADAGDQIMSDVALVPGLNANLCFSVPATAAEGATTYARYRFNREGGLTFTGTARDGEVEDYAVEIDAPELDLVPPVPWHDPLCAGWRQRYTLVFVNTTDAALTGVVMTDTIPNVELTVLLDESSAGGVYDGDRQVSWDLGTVAPGEEIVRYLELRIWASVPDQTILTNCVTVGSDAGSGGPVCVNSLIQQCVPPTATPSPTPTMTPTPTPTMTPTPTPSPTGTHVYVPLILQP